MTVVPLRPLRPSTLATPAAPAVRRRRLLRPGWPLTWMLVGFPLWWVLGISSFIGHLAAVVMVLELARLRRIRVPRSTGTWLLFLLWVIAGVLVLQVAAPHAVPDTSMGRYISWAYRFGWYASATVALVYIGNMREHLTTSRITRAGAAMFLTVVAGGWLGILMPHLVFPSVLEVVLPGSLTHVEFIEFLIHPEVSQDYAQAVASHPRPSAPFSYANIWGLNFACFLPFFLHAWLGPDAGWRRRLALPLLGLATVPAILSLNRGMWIAVVAMAVVVALRSAAHGRMRSVVALGASVLLLAGAVAFSPLGDLVQSRIANPVSNDGRASLATLTVQSVLEGSPVIGFGSTRDAVSAFYSIAGGSSPSCPLCTPPALGTQGQLWLVLYSQGVLGLVFYLGFLGAWLLRGLRLPSPAATVGVCVLVAQVVTLPFYDSIGISSVAALIAVGLLWREDDDRRAAAGHTDPSDEYSLGGFIGLTRRHALLLLVCAVAGVGAGAAYQVSQGPQSVATVSIFVPEESELADVGREATLDTLAQLARDRQVTSAMAAAAEHPIDPDDVYVSADPNSRILNLRYAGSQPGAALAAVDAAGETVIRLRTELLDAERKDAVAQFDAQYTSGIAAVATVDESLDRLRDSGTGVGLETLENQRTALLDAAGRAAGRGARAAVMPLDAGQVVRPAAVTVSHDALVVAMGTGLFLGLLVGLALARVRGVVGAPLARVRDVAGSAEVPVIATLPARAVTPDGRTYADHELAWRSAVDVVRLHSPAAVVAAGRDEQSLLVAELLDDRSHDDGRTDAVRRLGAERAVVVVATSTTRLGRVRRRVAGLRRDDLDVVGLVLIRRPRPGWGTRLRSVITTHRKDFQWSPFLPKK
ncbi:hypothetical protein [Phycicoccus sonneratiae]|uniref:O-antigen ligase family protein n=1 Tax=Phycicoccus sonneratiae TaxID=2807628 RepID=A0ABS2CQB2_9MICO|nr:hypothetical protein [Phycicoccus sonneraticus]MBM6402082.1 hypothetical protein [Phycicoccus sonneraticus]